MTALDAARELVMKTARVTIRLLREFNVEAPELGVTELSKRMNLDKSTVHRLLRALCDEGIIQQDPDSKKYSLGMAILNLAAARLHSLGFVEQAADEMMALREVVNESVALHVRDGYDVVCVHSNESSHRLTVRFTLGERSPIHLVAGGLVHLADIPSGELEDFIKQSITAHPKQSQVDPKAIIKAVEETTRDGAALTDEMLQKGLRGLATAIRDNRGKLLGSLSIVVPSIRLSVSELRRFAPKLIGAAERIGSKARKI
jgi:DNA-binding IclR family transcriptional regulator